MECPLQVEVSMNTQSNLFTWLGYLGETSIKPKQSVVAILQLFSEAFALSQKILRLFRDNGGNMSIPLLDAGWAEQP